MAACAAIYTQTLRHDFVNFDDGLYVTKNPEVQAGLSWRGLVWAFQTNRSLNFQPLTWLSHTLDCQLYGLCPWGHHLTNLLFHAANAVLLFLVLKHLTGAAGKHSESVEYVWPCALAAGLLAVHPLHVESVAWVSERKDVLSMFFWLLALGAYSAYARWPGVIRYLMVLVAFSLGLMAKPMVVSLPCVLLLLDYWPLRRCEKEHSSPLRTWSWLVVEKIPFFALSAVVSVVALTMQQHGGNLIPEEIISVKARLANAVVAYVFYLSKAVWPYPLAVFYPHPITVRPLGQIACSVLLLATITVAVLAARKRHRFLLVGWLWFLGTLIPVIQIFQTGLLAYADRYAYIPLIGIYIIVAWGLSALVSAKRLSPGGGRNPAVKAAAGAAGVGLVLLTALSINQAHYWRDSQTLFQHAVNVTEDNDLAHYNYGNELANAGRVEDAVFHYREALRINPGSAKTHNNLGVLLAGSGLFEEAVQHYQEALRLYPEYAFAHNNYGLALMHLGKIREAEEHFREALRIDPAYAEAQTHLNEARAAQRPK